MSSFALTCKKSREKRIRNENLTFLAVVKQGTIIRIQFVQVRRTRMCKKRKTCAMHRRRLSFMSSSSHSHRRFAGFVISYEKFIKLGNISLLYRSCQHSAFISAHSLVKLTWKFTKLIASSKSVHRDFLEWQKMCLWTALNWKVWPPRGITNDWNIIEFVLLSEHEIFEKFSVTWWNTKHATNTSNAHYRRIEKSEKEFQVKKVVTMMRGEQSSSRLRSALFSILSRLYGMHTTELWDSTGLFAPNRREETARVLERKSFTFYELKYWMETKLGNWNTFTKHFIYVLMIFFMCSALAGM